MRGLLRGVPQCALPNNCHPPALSAQLLDMPRVACNVPLKFSSPELPICLGSGCITTAFVLVPETTVNEYHRLVFWEDQIWRARKTSRVQSIAEPFSK